MKKILTFVVVLAMVVSAFAACSGTPAASTAPSAAPSTAPSTEESAAPGTEQSAAPSQAASSSLDQLLAKEDKLALSGIVSGHLESRADINKGLPVQKKDKVTIGWTGASLGSTFFQGMMDSANAKAAEYGYTMNYQNASFDLNAQQNHLDTFITQKVDIIVCNAVDVDSTMSYYERAVAAGIPVIITGPKQAKDSYQIITTFLSGSNESGFQVGLYAAEKLYKKGEVLKMGVTQSDIQSADAHSRPCGFIAGWLYKSAEMDGTPYASKWDAVLEAYEAWTTCFKNGSYDGLKDKGLDIVGYGVGVTTDAAGGQKASSDLITAHPDMDLIFVEEDSQALGVIQEIKQHNMEPGKDILLCCGADGTKEAMEYIQQGVIMATASNCPYYDGEYVINLIHDIFANGFDANNMPANSFTPTFCINADNVAQYYDANLAFAKPDPWKVMTIDEYNAANEGK